MGAFVESDWHWPPEVIKPLHTALKRKQIEIDKSQQPVEEIRLVTLHFDGTIEPRALQGQKGFKGKLFLAEAGDVIYSKIDVRNGAIGIVPDEMAQVAVSGEFPVYDVLPKVANPRYVQLLFRTQRFRRIINSMISGTSGRKRVQPAQLEYAEVPLPSLPVQQAIVARWHQAREDVRVTAERIELLEGQILNLILTELGIPAHVAMTVPKVFALSWKEMERWSVNYLARTISDAKDVQKASYPLKYLGNISTVSYGLQKSPANRPSKDARPYLRVANVQRGELDLSEIKYINVPDKEMENFRLRYGDLLVCEGNSADLVGRPALWKDEIPDCVHQNHILKVRVDSACALPEFILEYMQTPLARNYFRARAKFTTNLASINSNDLRELPIPLPPLDVQRDIMRRVEEGRAEIAREREAADRKAREAEAEVEALILGTKQLGTV